MSSMKPPAENWIKKPNGHSDDASVELIYQHYDDGKYWMYADVLFNGCINLRKAFNSPYPKEDKDQDYIHICDIDEIIKILTLLKEKSKEHFGNDWPTRIF